METSFIKGMNDAPKRHQVEIRSKSMAMLGITSRTQWQARRDGNANHTPAERKAIESIFEEYGITDPWGKD